MKNFLLVRHAKSSWKFPELQDRERPLNERGNSDGPYMAAYCRGKGILLDRIISSPAVRAYSTAQYFLAEYAAEVELAEKETDLYFGSEEDWMYIINNLDEGCLFPAFFSHNPTITGMVNRFTEEYISNVPTCGVIHLQSSATTWDDVDNKNTRIVDYYFPKLVRPS